MLVKLIEIKGPVSQPTYQTLLLPLHAERYYISAMFYTDDTYTTLASPSAGTLTVTASETGEQYGDVGVINASEAGATSTYTRLHAAGPLRTIKVDVAGVVGATHFIIGVASYA